MIPAIIAAASTVLAGSASADPDPEDVPFADAVFAASHNSYSGGARGTILEQLDLGLRFLEYDVHDNGYAGDYQIGHDDPGNQVSHDGTNPDTNNLKPWLEQVNTWSSNNVGHAPVTIALDLKDNLTDNKSFAEGNLAALNKELIDTFGTRLVLAGDYPSATLPRVKALANKVIVVLSGDQRTRALYRRDTAKDPAVSMNTQRRIVEVHKSPDTNNLWSWTGTLDDFTGEVRWWRHSQYDAGATPAVAINDHGDVVEVHKSVSDNRLWYRIGGLNTVTNEILWGASHAYDTGLSPSIAINNSGQVVEVHQDNGTNLWYTVGQLVGDQISWGPGHRYDGGQTPSVAFTSLTGNTLKEVHLNSAGNQNYTWNGQLNATTGLVTWSGVAKTGEGLLKTKSTRGAYSVTIWTGSESDTPLETLHYTSSGNRSGRIQYQQMAFTEYQSIDKDADGTTRLELMNGALFYAAPASDTGFINRARGDHKAVRGWEFKPPVAKDKPIATFPATDEPRTAEYWTTLIDHNVIWY